MAATVTFSTAMEEPLTTRTLLRTFSTSRSPQEQDSEQRTTGQERAIHAEKVEQETGIRYIHTQAEHSTVTSHAESTSTPTVLYVSYSPAPPCRRFTAAFKQLVAAYTNSQDKDEREIVWCQMEYGKETSPMMKFGPQHCPILILLKGGKCRTILGGDVRELEQAVRLDFLQ